jgi:hypothetical protein
MIKFLQKFLIGFAFMFGIVRVNAQNSIALKDNSIAAKQVSQLELPVKESAPHKIFRLNTQVVNAQLAKVALKQASVKASIGIPMPDGTEENFILEEYNVMHPLLAAKYPEIKTYKGRSTKSPGIIVYVDQTPAGFHAMILDKAQIVYVNPGNLSKEKYVSFYKKDLKERSVTMTCGIEQNEQLDYEKLIGQLKANDQVSSGTNLKIYRLALAATGEYTAARGGTVASALASMVTTMNRVNGIYENELSIRMELIPETDKLIYTNYSTDPYSNFDGYAMLDQNQANIDAVIDSNNYDIGHVFSTGGGGIAQLNSPCNNTFKAMGVTGSPNPSGDAFDVDYVAHEMGHQFGANHTFNSNQGSCQGNKNQSTAFEPGSGSTIMAYAGICSSDNIQSAGDAYFHTISLDEIIAYTTSDKGATCPVISSAQNIVPVVEASGDYYIPVNTPFKLSGNASDENGDELLYNWEQIDAGPSGSPKIPSGTAPSFRSLPPTSSPTRIFPKFGVDLIGEVLPSYARTLNFRLTVRDNHPGGGAIAHNITPVTVNVVNTVDPFKITYYVDGSKTWFGGASGTIMWNVASTDKAPINCNAVNILLSTDGGYNYPIILASNVPNTGSAEVTMPDIASSQARIKVEAADNIFFNYSDANFTIKKTNLQEPDSTIPQIATKHLTKIYPNPFREDFSVSLDSISDSWTNLKIINSLGSLVKNYDFGHTTPSLFKVDMSNQPAGLYLVVLSSESRKKSYKVIKQ